MAKEGGLGRDRTEEAFSTLSSKGAASAPSAAGPWMIAALLLLLVALGLPLAYGIRESRRRMAREGRFSSAVEEAESALRHQESGDLRAAILGLDRTVSALGEVAPARRTAKALAAAVGEKLAEIERLREALDQRRRMTGVKREALDALLTGEAEKAVEDLRKVTHGDPVGRSLLTLAGHLARWNQAERAEGEARVLFLETLASDWPLPALASAGKRVSGNAESRRHIVASRQAAEDALSRGDLEAARTHFEDTLAAAGLAGVLGLQAKLDRRVRFSLADRLEKRGALEEAAAVYRYLAMEGGHAVAEEQVRRLERILAKRTRSEFLSATSAAFEREGAHLPVAVLEALATREETGVRTDYRESVHWAAWLEERARDLHARGEFRASRAVAREAAEAGGARAKDLELRAEATIRSREQEEAVWRARDALKDEAPAHAEGILAQARVESPPADVVKAIAELHRAGAERRALASLARGDGLHALRLLEDAGLAKEPRLATFTARAMLLLGDVDGGLALLPEKPVVRMIELVRAALGLPLSDRAGFASLLSRALQETGPREDLQAAVALALEEAGRSEAARPLWEALRDAALRRAPLVKPGE